MSFVVTTFEYTDSEYRPTGARAQLIVPESAALKRKAQELQEKQGKGVQLEEWRGDGRRAYHGVPVAEGTTVIYGDDERDLKYDRPLLIYDHRPGHAPLCMVLGGARYTQEALEHLEEARHYEPEDATAAWWDRQCPPALMQQQANDWLDRVRHYRPNVSRFAFRNTAGLAATPQGMARWQRG